jgi:hypothetical protein
MHEADRSTSDKAVHQIAERLALSGISGQPLQTHELKQYHYREFVAGWEFRVQFSDRNRHLRLLVPRNAPWSSSRVALVDAPFLKWPHVERDGILCLRPNSWTINSELPGEVALEELAAAVELIESLVNGDGEADFRDEFRTYWELTCKVRTEPIFCIVEPTPPSRQVHVWRGNQFALVGDSPESIVHWLQKRFPDSSPKEWFIERAGLIWLHTPPTPAEFPSSMAKLKELTIQTGVDLHVMLDGFQADDSGEFLVVLGAQANNGTGFIGVSIRQNSSRYKFSSINNGFRKGKIPSDLMAKRVLSGTLVARTVERADASWVHGRDQDTRQAILQNARIVILGCGSVGSHVADLLASGGVGNLRFVDPEVLTWSNVGRHTLGAEFVGKNKAESLAQRIGKRLPHIDHLEAKSEKWQQVMRTSPEKLTDCDLIISTIGDWSSECQLNAWHLTQGSKIPILYGWTEAYCCAGHAVVIHPERACLQCGFSPEGVVTFQVGDWPNGPTIRQEPACGSDFQPYGPVEMIHVCAMIADLALDCLLNPLPVSTHRVWAGSQRLLESTGGQWTQSWRNLAVNSNLGSRQEQRIWPQLDGCPACGRSDHA